MGFLNISSILLLFFFLGIAFTLLKLDGGGFLKLILDMASKWLLTSKELGNVHKKRAWRMESMVSIKTSPDFF